MTLSYFSTRLAGLVVAAVVTLSTFSPYEAASVVFGYEPFGAVAQPSADVSGVRVRTLHAQASRAE